LVHRKCRETVATEFGHFLRSVFGVEIVAAEAVSLISTVKEHHYLQVAPFLRASAHGAPPGFVD
jgi:hypothetical protein